MPPISRISAREKARTRTLHRQTRPAERQVARAPAPDEALGARLQGLWGNGVLHAGAAGVDEGFAQVVADNLALAAVGVDPAAGSFSGSNQAMLRAMRAVGAGGAAADGDAAVTQSLRRAGAPLPAEIQARLEAHFGVSLDAVRIHTDGTAAVASAAIHAHAFSTGAHVLFGQGEYRPHTTEGLELLAHEVTHVVQHLQQRAGAATAVENGVPVTRPSDAVEREAVDAARAFVTGGSVSDVGADTGAAAGVADDVVGAPILDAPTVDAPGTDTPSLGAGVMARNGPAAEAPDSHGTVATVGGPGARAGGWEFARNPDGSWKVQRRPESAPAGVQSSGSAEAGHTLVSGEASTSVASGSTTVSGSGGTLQADGTVLGASAEGAVKASADAEGFAIKAEGGAALTVVSGKLRYTTPECAFGVLGETLKAKAYIELTAEVAATVKGELGFSLKPGGDGVSLDGGGEAFAGARAGIKGGIACEWKPRAGPEFLELAGAFAGAEGWAGAAAAFDASFSLYPSVKAEFNYGVALGFGGSVTYGVEAHLLHVPMLMLTLVGRGAALALDAVGMEYLARALNQIIDSFWDDDAARAAVTAGVHRGITVAERIKLCNRMLSGACLDEDEDALLTVFRDSIASGEVAALAHGVEGGVLGLIEKFDGDQYAQMMALLYVDAHITDIPIDDDVARTLVELGLHPRMPMEDVRRSLTAMLDGFTGDADEGAILRVLRERPDWKTVVTADITSRCLDDFNGEEYDALVGYFFLHDFLEDVDFDDDVARAVIRQRMHLGVDDDARLKRCFDELISGATGDDDEACIVRLLLDKPGFTASLSAADLQSALDDVDGEEHEDLLVALRKGRRIDLADTAYDVDDNVARKLVAQGVHTDLSVVEARRCVDELVSGFTGNDDEGALLRILVDNPTKVAEILDTTEKRQTVLDNCHGEESDALTGLYVLQNLLPGLEIDDDVARAIVRIGLHRQVADGTVLLKMIDALIDGFTGDDDEAAIIALLTARPDLIAGLDGDLVSQVIDNVDGEELCTLFVLLYQNNRMPTSPLPDKFDDDAARLFIERGFHRDTAKWPVNACHGMLDALLAGFTGDDDEARILTLLTDRAGDVLKDMALARIDEILSHTHGEEETRLFVLLQKNGKLTLPHGDFDDDAARAFIAEGLHRTMSADQLVHLVDAMIAGGTFNDDESALLTLVRDKPEVLDTLGNEKIRTVLNAFDGEEWDQLVVYLYKIGKGGIDLADPNFTRLDDDTARLFVAEGLHTRMTAAEIERLLDELTLGSCGDDDEDAILRILREAWGTAEAALTPACVRQLLDAVDGEQDDRLQAILWEKNKLPEGWDLDDDVARGLVREGRHRGADVARARQLLDALQDGFTGDDDEAMILELLRGNAALLSALTADEAGAIYDAFHGDEESELLVLFLEAGKITLDDERVDDNAARLLVTRGKHRTFTAQQNNQLVRKLLSGACMDGDEAAILAILTDRAGETAAILSGIALDDLFGGFQADHYRALTKRLLAANYQRDTILDQHVTAGCAYWLVHNEGTAGLAGAQKGKLVKVLRRELTQDNQRAILHLFENDTAGIGAMVAEVGLDQLHFFSVEGAEIEFLVFKHVPTHRDTLLEGANGLLAARLIRGRAYQAEMSDHQRAALVRRLVDRAEDGQRHAFEVLDWAKRNAPAGFTALVGRLGGPEATKSLFSGAICTDVERLLAPPSSS